MIISFCYNLLLGLLIFIMYISVVYITAHVIINISWWLPLFLNICVYIIYIIAIVITLLFLNLTYSVCKGKGLRYYISFHLDLFSLLPLGVKIIIFIRLFFIFFCISDFIMSNIAIEYSLCMLPNHGDFSQILGPTVAGPGQNGSNLPPTGGGSNLPPTGVLH